MRKTIWFAGAILVLFVLAHDFWAWGEPVSIGPWGWPRWIFVFAILQIVLSIVIYWFGDRAWRTDDPDSDGGA